MPVAMAGWVWLEPVAMAGCVPYSGGQWAGEEVRTASPSDVGTVDTISAKISTTTHPTTYVAIG